VLLTLIAAAAFATTMAGGLLALKVRDRLHLILGFSAGAVIGVAFFDLLPEAVSIGMKHHGAAAIFSTTALGFLSYLVLDRILSFHGDTAHRAGVTAAVLCVHSLLDGVAIGVAFQTSRAVGAIVAIAVLTHDFSDGVNTMNVVLRNRGARPQALRWLLLDAVAPVFGIVEYSAAEFLASRPGVRSTWAARLRSARLFTAAPPASRTWRAVAERFLARWPSGTWISRPGLLR